MKVTILSWYWKDLTMKTQIVAFAWMAVLSARMKIPQEFSKLVAVTGSIEIV